MSQEMSSAVTSGCVQTFFNLLGWKVSGGEKDLPFGCVFKALDVQISLTEWYRCRVLMENTEKRILEFNDCIDRILDSSTLTCATSLALRGRMQFANSQVWGRASKVCLKQVALHAYGDKPGQVEAPLVATLSTFSFRNPDGEAQLSDTLEHLGIRPHCLRLLNGILMHFVSHCCSAVSVDAPTSCNA